MKRMFGKKKEMTPEQNREQMMNAGIQVNQGGWRQPKFSNFSDHAKTLAASKHQSYGPNAPAPPSAAGQSSNPYAAAGAQLNYAPSSASSRPPTYQSNYSNGYGDNNGGGGGGGPGNSNQPPRASPYATAQKSYQTRFGSQSQPSLERQQTNDTFDQSRNALFSGAKPQNQGLPGRTAMASYGSQSALPNTNNISADDELNMTPAELDAARGGYRDTQESQLDSEDEDVETIKGQIRFTKQESVQSTRRALQIAADAEESGRNTLGMLGSQGERLANTEQNLALASTQNKIAEEKARELKTLNRSMFAVHVPNPFGAKRRLQEKEDRLKADKRMEQEMREQRRQTAYDSQQRVQNGLQPKSELAQKYKQKTGERKKYQFEEDSEDEAMEDEIDANLDGIASATQRLKKLAQATNEEVTRQNERLDHIANSTDTLDVNVHLNTNRLANIR